jgi:hypothetical protein
MAPLPDCTLTTACFLLNKYNQNGKTLEDCIKGMDTLLRTPCYLVIYCNPPLVNHIKERRSFYLESLTRIVVREVEDLWAYQFAEQIRKNRTQYWPTADPRISTESTVLVFNKFQFLYETIEHNPFGTSKFGWIDGHLGENGSKICGEGDFERRLLNTLHHVPSTFRVQMLNVEDKKFKEDQHKREFYEKARWSVVGCLFTTSAEIGKKILSRIKEVIAHTVALGYGHGDEYFYLEVLDEFEEEMSRAYGDYKDTLSNFIRPTANLNFVYWGTIIGNYNMGYYKECIAACRAVISSLEDFETSPNTDMYVRVYSTLYLALRASRSPEVEQVANTIRQNYKTSSLFQYHFNNLKYICLMHDFPLD